MKKKISEFEILAEDHIKQALVNYLNNDLFKRGVSDISVDFFFDEDQQRWYCEVEILPDES